MKGFQREDLWFSLCGLNCGLCPMKLDGHCPGCGGGAGNQSCAIARCSLGHGGVDYCFQCGEYPCPRYEAVDAFDSFITHQRRAADVERAQRIGPEAYRRELEEKSALLRRLLDGYNDGRRKTLFCVAVNLLELEALRAVMEALSAAPALQDQPVKERAAQAADLLQAAAEQQGVVLKLRRKPGKSS